MNNKELLMIPGPTPVPDSIIQEMTKQVTAHRSNEFSAIIKRVEENLKCVFQTKSNVHIYTSSGTGAMCSSISNLVNNGDKVLCLITGVFGERFKEIAISKGANVIEIKTPFGKAINPDDVNEILNKNKDIKLVTMTHSETSTGVLNPIKEIIEVIKKYDALSIVDGISSVCATECPMDDWGIDVLISGSQKGFMIPPGLSFLAASKKALEEHKNCTNPDYYFNWSKYESAFENNTTPFTPSVNLIYALDSALIMIKEKGLKEIYKNHIENSLLLRNGLRKMGLKLLVENDSISSPAVTAFFPPDGISVQKIRETMKEKYDIIIANGQKDLKDKIIRIGTLGFISKRDVLTVLCTLNKTIESLRE